MPYPLKNDDILTPEGCKQRLTRFHKLLEEQRLDVAVVSNSRHVYYLIGHLCETDLPQVLVVCPGSKTVLVTDSEPDAATSHEVITYESVSIDWPVSFAGIVARAAEGLRRAMGTVKSSIRRVGLEKDRLSGTLLEAVASRWSGAERVELAPIFGRMRKSKDSDEIQLVAQCVKVIEAGYVAARKTIRPGLTELDVFKEVHGEIVRRAGYNLKFEGDFACGERALREGGTPLPREVLAGDLYILDIYPSFHGYYGDLCRTFVASTPTDLQVKAWEVARDALRLAEEIIRPGIQARYVWKQLRDFIDSFEFVRGSFRHHGGHGLGLDPQEPPWIIPGSDHVFEVDDVIAVEPGCYSKAIQGGVRLECDYVIRETGLEKLSQFPLDL